MIRTALTLALLLISAVYSFAGQGMYPIPMVYVAGGADVTAPTLSTFVIGTDGDTWTFTYDENVTATDDGDMCDGYAVTMSTAGALTFTYGSGTRGSTNVFTCTGSATVNADETITAGLDYTQGTIADTSTNALVAIDDKTTGFTNNSEVGGGTPPAYVQSNSGYNSGPITRTGVTEGNALVACISGGSALTSTSVAGFTAAIASSTTGSGTHGRCYYQLAAAGGNLSATITGAPSDAGWIVREYSNVTGLDNAAAGSTGVTSPYTTASLTVNQADAMVVVFVADETANTGAITWTGSGMGTAQSDTSHAHYANDHALTGTGSYSTTFTGNNNASNNLTILLSLY